jgi:hypothetical protein
MTENQTQAAPDAIRAALCTADDRFGIPCFFLSRDGTCNQLPSEDACRCRPALARLAALEAALEAADHLAGFVDVSTIRASRDAEWGNRLAAYRTARYRAG